MQIIGTLISFGALFIPTYYFLFMTKSAPTNRRMFFGVGLQVFWSALVGALVYFSWRAGHAEYYRAWGLLIPVNVVSAIFFAMVLFFHNRDVKIKK